ncbi:hypothetical protein GAYE_SCF07G2907 [Galdieria yellowstonensis]|uniref:2Fe-2S ferredoxin-type domain-containing protein n=1 Tax=Galdieria yellowstonensis TaxID=3028027 RepID=A0AAV9ICD1_9RHOD|nr:hypothetical protein GAYE_SCF07G2907 [Galdieria yellowstonensis]
MSHEHHIPCFLLLGSSPLYHVLRSWKKTRIAPAKCKPQLVNHVSTSNNQVRVTFLPEKVSVWASPGEPLYKVAERAGVELLFDCCVGDCGSCQVQLMSQHPAKKRMFIRPCIAKVPDRSELILHTVGSDIPPW